MGYLDDVLKPYGFTLTKASTSTPSLYCYVVKCNKPAVTTILNWVATPYRKSFWDENISKLVSILFNGIPFDQNKSYNEDILQEFVDTYFISLSPSDKLDTVLEYLNKISVYDGQPIISVVPDQIAAMQRYFHGVEEWKFYLASGVEQGLIKRISTPNQLGSMTAKYNLTVSGLTRLIQASEGYRSRLCFIAMSFTEDMFAVLQEAIDPALRATGFEALIVSRVDVDSDKTINDAILAGIKRSRFTIADFTHHKSGVYFEAGYSLGRGQKVIYTCREDEMKNAHFDIRNYQHIVWTNNADLKVKLINKIEAFIKD